MAQAATKTGGTSAQGRALAVLRILIGVFLIAEGAAKIGWLLDADPLSERLASYLRDGVPAARWYLRTVAIPGVELFARLVVIGEVGAGIALVLGVSTRLVATLALLMVINFHVASSAIFRPSFLSSGYGLPVVGALLALVMGGKGLPWSLRK